MPDVPGMWDHPFPYTYNVFQGVVEGQEFMYENGSRRYGLENCWFALATHTEPLVRLYACQDGYRVEGFGEIITALRGPNPVMERSGYLVMLPFGVFGIDVVAAK